MADIDRIFIATNFEEEQQEGNEDRSLCRFEFYEILVRMAREKYHDKKILPTIAASCEALIKEILIKNFIPIEENFRFEQVWTLEIDELFKANLDKLKQVFLKYADFGKKLNLDKLVEMIVDCQGSELSLDELTLNWAFTKTQFIREMEDVAKYRNV